MKKIYFLPRFFIPLTSILLIAILEGSIYADEYIEVKGLRDKMDTKTVKISSLSDQCYSFEKITGFEEGYCPSINNLGEIVYEKYDDNGNNNIYSTVRGWLTFSKSGEVRFPDINNSGEVVYADTPTNQRFCIISTERGFVAENGNLPSINNNGEIVYLTGYYEPCEIISSTRGSLVSGDCDAIGGPEINDFGEVVYINNANIFSTTRGQITFFSDSTYPGTPSINSTGDIIYIAWDKETGRREIYSTLHGQITNVKSLAKGMNLPPFSSNALVSQLPNGYYSNGVVSYPDLNNEGQIVFLAYVLEKSGNCISNSHMQIYLATPMANCLDSDNDGILNAYDNCPNITNPDQTDADGDGVGDACDNCPNIYNYNQTDTDGDGIICDNCPLIFNPDQADRDRDGVGDVCDNCPDICNSQQLDADCDGIGDVCEASPNCGVSYWPDCEEPCTAPEEEECSVTISPATVTVDCGDTIQFAAIPSGTCATPDYACSVISTIGSTITQSGLYTAGINCRDCSASYATDVIVVTDRANGDITATATVVIPSCCLCCPPLTVEPDEGRQGQTYAIELSTTEDIFKDVDKKDIIVDLGAGITVNELMKKSGNTLKADITIEPDTPLGIRTVLLTTPQDCAEGTFTVRKGPSITLHPLFGKKGETLDDAKITGSLTHFANGKTEVKFDKEITIKQVTVVDANTITMKIKINENAEIGIHDVIVTTELGGGMEEVATTSFMVLPE
jgi:hypothetical protein